MTFALYQVVIYSLLCLLISDFIVIVVRAEINKRDAIEKTMEILYREGWDGEN